MIASDALGQLCWRRNTSFLTFRADGALSPSGYRELKTSVVSETSSIACGGFYFLIALLLHFL
jgi:hypothetical protein